MNTTTVTLKPKCYVFVCAGCDLLEQSQRNDALTCSPACRVRAHRSGVLRKLRDTAKSIHVPPAMLLQAAAIKRLSPETAAAVASGAIELDEAQRRIWPIFWDLLVKARDG